MDTHADTVCPIGPPWLAPILAEGPLYIVYPYLQNIRMCGTPAPPHSSVGGPDGDAASGRARVSRRCEWLCRL